MEAQQQVSKQDEVSPLRVYRIAAAMSQADLAMAAGLTRTTISNLERKATAPSARSKRRIALALSASPEVLFPGEGV